MTHFSKLFKIFKVLPIIAFAGCSDSTAQLKLEKRSAYHAASPENDKLELGGPTVNYDKQPQCLPREKIPTAALPKPIFDLKQSFSPTASHLAVVRNFDLGFSSGPDIAIKNQGFNIGLNQLDTGFFRDINGCKIPGIRDMTTTAYYVFIGKQTCASVNGRIATISDLANQGPNLLLGLSVQAVLTSGGSELKILNLYNGSIKKLNTSSTTGNNCRQSAGSIGGGCFETPPENRATVVCAPSK